MSRKFKHRHVCAQRRPGETRGEDDHPVAKGWSLRMKQTLHTPCSGLPASGTGWRYIPAVEATPWVVFVTAAWGDWCSVFPWTACIHVRELEAVLLNKHVSASDPKTDWLLGPRGDCPSSGERGENDWSPAGFCSQTPKDQDPSVHVIHLAFMNYLKVPLDSVSMFSRFPKFICNTTPNLSSPNTICTMLLLLSWC